MNYLLSRIGRALQSPQKLREYLRILVRFPYLLIYYRLYDWKYQQSKRWKAERRATQPQYELEKNPLISVVIATYNRADLLRDRPLKSVLEQTYQNFEVIIVGDGCSDHTAEAIASLNDPRLHFFNLSERSSYPADAKHRWMVAGIPPMNVANDRANGLWIAHLDDDEIVSPDHLEKLLRFAQRGNFEFVYSKAQHETSPGVWEEVGNTPIVKLLYMNHCGHSTTLWRRYLNHFNYDIRSWRIGVAGDQNRWCRLQLAGVRIGFLPEITNIAPLRPGVTLFGHQSEDRI